MSSIGIVGAGAMGSGFAERLLAGGHRVDVWNRTPAALEPLVALGAIAAPTPAEVAARSDFVITIAFSMLRLSCLDAGCCRITLSAN